MKKFIALAAAVTISLCSCTTLPRADRVRTPTIGCDFGAGYSHGVLAVPYDGSCKGEKEETYLIGYGVGRKMRWTDQEFRENSKLLECVTQDMDVKFTGPNAPMDFEVQADQETLVKKIKESGCYSDLKRSKTDAEADLLSLKRRNDELELKLTRLQQLQNKISVHPADAQTYLTEYAKEGLDPLDVNLRWGKLIAARGGVEKLTGQEKILLYQELRKPPPLPRDISNGALIGFGLGEKRQGRSGWLYTVIDSLILGAAIYGIASNQPSITLPALVFGVPISRGFQYWSVYSYNLEHSQEVRDLRTEGSRFFFRYVFN